MYYVSVIGWGLRCHLSKTLYYLILFNLISLSPIYIGKLELSCNPFSTFFLNYSLLGCPIHLVKTNMLKKSTESSIFANLSNNNNKKSENVKLSYWGYSIRLILYIKKKKLHKTVISLEGAGWKWKVMSYGLKYHINYLSNGIGQNKIY